MVDFIDAKARKESIEDWIEPTEEEYEEFFNKFDGEYKIVSGYPESIYDDSDEPRENTFSITFDDNKKAHLNTHSIYDELEQEY